MLLRSALASPAGLLKVALPSRTLAVTAPAVIAARLPRKNSSSLPARASTLTRSNAARGSAGDALGRADTCMLVLSGLTQALHAGRKLLELGLAQISVRRH